ncbi:MAG: hypothetical protein QM775_00670 [Pirellulales bacterium]
MFARTTIVLLILAVAPLSVRGGEHVDSQGFRFTYPAGWTAVTEEVRQNIGNIPASVRNWMADNKVDLSRVSVVVLRDGQAEFLRKLERRRREEADPA